MLLGTAEGFGRVLPEGVWAFDQSSHDRTERALRAALSTEEFDACVAEGARLSWEDVTELAAELPTRVPSSQTFNVAPGP